MSSVSPFPVTAQEYTIGKIISEADTLVPNSIDLPSKINWLNEINQQFFEVVKIPIVYVFSVTAGQANYTIPAGYHMVLRNVDRVVAGTSLYRSLQMEDVPPGNNGWILNEATNTLTLSPAPPADAPAYIRYMMKSYTVFSATLTDPANGQTLQQKPDAPAAYHQTYIMGLCERVAKAMDDVIKANNYASDFRSQLGVAQHAYSRAGGVSQQ